MKKIAVVLLMFGLIGCGPSALSIKTSFKQAQASYEKLLTTYPGSIDTQGYRIYIAKARSAYDNGDYTSAKKYVKQASKQAENAYKTRIGLKADVGNRIEINRQKMNKLLIPNHMAVHLFFSAVNAYDNNNYRKAASILKNVSNRLNIDARTAFEHTVTLYVPRNMKSKFGNNVPVYKFLGNDLKLHKPIAGIKTPAEVDFINQFFVNENFSYFHIKSDKLHIDGWVYPQFVIIGKIKEVK